MKKWLFLVISGVMVMSAHANQTWCDYKDFFRLSDNTHPGIYIVSGFGEYDLYLQIVGPRSFLLRDTGQCRSGYAHITVAYDAANWCVLDIKDGPLMNHPVVNSSCNGLRYLDTTYDGVGSYSYNINIG
ncbi:MAG: hypothetical protein ACHP65_05445 [Legionellales bacterium]